MKTNVDPDLFFSMTGDFLDIYLATQTGGSKSTNSSYSDALYIFRKYVTEETKMSCRTLTFKDVNYDFLLDYRNALGAHYEPSTVNHRLAVIKSYFKYACSRRVNLQQYYFAIEDVPGLNEPQIIQPIIEDKETLTAFLDSPSQSKIGIRDRTILAILYDTAIRADELIGMMVCEVNTRDEQPYVFVHGKGAKERRVGLHENTVTLIEQYKGLYHVAKVPEKRPFFYTIVKGKLDFMSERNLERIVQKYADKVRNAYPDIPKHVSPHTLRRTRATGWYRDGIPIETIAILLGHEHVETTKKHYAKYSVEQLRKEAEKGSEVIPKPECNKPVKMWESDEEFAKAMGIR